MTPREAAERFDELIDFVRNTLPGIAERVAATDLVALITNRVVQKGLDFNGASFSSYSTTDIPAYKFWGKSRTQSAEAKLRDLSRQKAKLSYATFRALNNLKTDKKNFEFTGEMWRKFGVISRSASGNNFKISLGGTTTAAQQKIDDNSAEEGLSIIENNSAEEAIIQQSIQDWLTQQAQRILQTI